MATIRMNEAELNEVIVRGLKGTGKVLRAFGNKPLHFIVGVHVKLLDDGSLTKQLCLLVSDDENGLPTVDCVKREKNENISHPAP